MEIAYVLVSLMQYQIQKLERVHNASARLVFAMPRYCHITPLLLDLHWLPVNRRIAFNKVLLLVYKVFHQLAPSYLVDLISAMPCSSYNLRRDNNGVLLRHLPAYSRKLWVIVHFRVPRLNYGTTFLLKLGVPILLYLLNRSLRHFYLKKRFIDILLFLCIHLFS